MIESSDLEKLAVAVVAFRKLKALQHMANEQERKLNILVVNLPEAVIDEYVRRTIQIDEESR